MRVKLIVNATASSVTPRTQFLVERILHREHEVKVAATLRRGHATLLAREAVEDGFDLVAVLAGDGTLNEASGGLIGSDLPLAALPGGSTNVYARTLGIINNAEQAAHGLLASLSEKTFRRVDVGRVNGRQFLFNAGVGFDAAVLERVERHPKWKRRLNHAYFAGVALATFASYERGNPLFALHDEAGAHVTDGSFAIISKTHPWTFFGPRRFAVAPSAGFDQPLVSTVWKDMRVGPMLLTSASALGSGALLRKSPAIHEHHGDNFVITSPAPIPWQADGDFLGTDTTFTFSRQSDALTIVVPATPENDADRW
ncbi:MAG: diacylglycerol kinase family protein [Acidimicrobiia bacterium]